MAATTEAPRQSYQQIQGSTASGGDLVTELENKLLASKRVRQRFEPAWFRNLAYYEGEQWVTFDGHQIASVELEGWRVKLVDNRIQPLIRTEIAKLTKTRPVFVGVPRSADDKDVTAARLTERLLEWQYKKLDLLRKLRAGLLWSRVCGSGFWKITWDPEKGDSTEILVNSEGKAIKDANGAPMKPQHLDQLPEGYADQYGVQTKRLAMGDIRVDVRTPFEIYPDPLVGEEGIEGAEWVIEEAVYSPAYVKARFKIDLQPDSDSIAGITESRMPGINLGSVPGNERKQGVCLREFWAKPCAEYPQGKHVVWTKTLQVLHESDNPYPWLPYVMFRGVPVPGRFWPGSVTDQLISPQTELNKRKAQIAENAERIGNPPLMKSSMNQDFEWFNLPGEILDFTDNGSPNAVPQFLRVPEVPGYVREDVDRIESSIREISGQHEVSSGTVPAGVTAASAINLLQEQDDTRLGPDIADMEEALAGAGQRVVYLCATRYTDQRVIRLAGEDGGWMFDTYKKGMLKSDQGVEVQSGSGLPQSKAAKQAAIAETLRMLAQMPNLQLSERDLRQVMQEYDIGGLEKFFATIGASERQIARENQRLALGQQLDVNEFDVDAEHIAGHNEWRRTSEYEELDPAIKANADAHVAAHVKRQADTAATSAAAALPPSAPSPTSSTGPPSAVLSPPQASSAT